MTSFMDPSSSPDPLGEDMTGSVRPSTVRRSTKPRPPAYLQSSVITTASARTLSSSAKSPRKQTFELDVGNPGSPQRLFVTVEADEQRGRRSGVSRRLFTASPTRSPSRRRGTTTTTTVPLRGLSDDEGTSIANEEPGVRRRGRPRGSLGSKNGTPAPRGKKRAGTPLQKSSKAKRHSGELAPDSTLLSDALTATGPNTGEPTPKPRTRTRKTPHKAGTPAVPSSKPTTGRKRGRPRKALLPDEMAALASEAEDRAVVDTDMLPNEDVPMPGDAPSEGGTHVDGNDIASAVDPAQDETTGPIDSFWLNGSTPRPPRRTDQRHPAGVIPDSEPIEGESTHGERAGDFDAAYSDDYMPLADPHSDLESAADDVDPLTHSDVDGLTHASDFSMIAVENLPSFQASFQGNLSRISEGVSEFAEAGEETNFIINQTLASLRRSTQSESQGQADQDPVRQPGEDEGPAAASPAVDDRNNSANFGSSQISWAKSSPRRPKPLPLSRQVFSSSRAPHVDDSFSSIPESVLHAATPGRLPMKPPAAEVTNEDDMYEDSFSEIPDEVLRAATPKPVSRTTAPVVQEGQSDASTSNIDPQSATRSTNIGSDRLPTPDDTNSSGTDARNGAGEEAQRAAADISSAAPNTSDLNICSSPPVTISRQFNTMNLHSETSQNPPTISRQFNNMAIQSDVSQPEQDAAGTPPRKSSSPQLPPTHSATAEHANTLQPPAAIRRPTLSPIVRAGRTLQNIMSDRSSPEGRESSLGSPFRGPVPNESRQSSVTKSPTRDLHHVAGPSHSQTLFNPIASLSQSIRSALGPSHRSVPAPVSAPAPAPVPALTVSQAGDPFGPDMSSYSQAEALRRSAYGADSNAVGVQPDQPAEFIASVTSSTRAALPSSEGEGIDWLANQSSPATQRLRRMSASQRSAHSSFLIARGSQMSRLAEVEQADEQDETRAQDEQNEQDESEGYNDQELEDVDEEDEEQEGGDHGREIEQGREEEEEEEEADQPPEGQLEEEGYDVNARDEDELVDDFIDEPRQEDGDMTEQGVVEAADEPGEEEEEEEENDEMDLWDIEASRPTPRSTKVLRAQAQARNQAQPQPEALSPNPPAAAAPAPVEVNSNPPRRSKIPSPWRRSTRRLIYQDDFKDPSEIEMEDSPPSDIELPPSAPAAPVRPETQQQEQPQKQPQVQRLGETPQQTREQHEEASEQHGGLQDEDDQEPHEEDYQDYGAPLYENSDDGSYDQIEPEGAAELDYLEEKQPLKHDVSVAEPTEVEDYSMAQEPVPEQPAPARRSFFGNFDILSFFSSPRPPPTNAAANETPAQQAVPRPGPKAIRSTEKSVHEEPHSALRATGLFPSIPQKAFNPSPERRTDLFSPGAPLRSADTVRTADLFLPSSPLRPADPARDIDTSSPGMPRRHSGALADISLPPDEPPRSTDTVPDTYADTPSTPERGAFPPIPQKRNFTPLSGQSRNTASLFTPSRQGSTPAQATRTPSPANDFFEEPDSRNAISSDPTDEPSFERIPPREKPSNWDKTLSPTKSCLRSPLKPKTPGRVVEFTSSVLGPEGQARAHVEQQRSLNALGNISSGGINGISGNALIAQRPILPAPVPATDGDKENNHRRGVSFNTLAAAPRFTSNTNTAALPNPGSRPPSKSAHSNPAATTASKSTPALGTHLSTTTWTREHWIRLDELTRLRRNDPLRFQMLHGNSAGGGNKPHPLVGMEVATGRAALVLESWHLEVVRAFRDAVLGESEKRKAENSDGEGEEDTPSWNDRALCKRLFALLVGEERRRKGEIVSSYGSRAGAGAASAANGQAVSTSTGATAAAGAAAAAAMAKLGRGQRAGVRTSPRRR